MLPQKWQFVNNFTNEMKQTSIVPIRSLPRAKACRRGWSAPEISTYRPLLLKSSQGLSLETKRHLLARPLPQRGGTSKFQTVLWSPSTGLGPIRTSVGWHPDVAAGPVDREASATSFSDRFAGLCSGSLASHPRPICICYLSSTLSKGL